MLFRNYFVTVSLHVSVIQCLSTIEGQYTDNYSKVSLSWDSVMSTIEGQY